MHQVNTNMKNRSDPFFFNMQEPAEIFLSKSLELIVLHVIMAIKGQIQVSWIWATLLFYKCEHHCAQH